MKKSLKTLSVLAFGSLIALSGASYAKAYTTNVQTEDVSTTAAMTGTIDSASGLYLVENQQISLLMGTNEQYIAEMDVVISTFETANDEMSDGYDIDVYIDMPDATDKAVVDGDSSVYNPVDSAEEIADSNKIALVLSQGTDTAYSYQAFSPTDTLLTSVDGTDNDFILTTDTANKPNVMDLYKSNTEFRVTLLNDPTSTKAITEIQTPDLNSWKKENTRVAFTNSWYLSDLDSTISNEMAPYFDNVEVTLYQDLAGTTEVTNIETQTVEGLSFTFDLYLNSMSIDQLVKDDTDGDGTIESGETNLDVFGHLLIPFTRTFNGVEYLYYYDINISGGAFYNNTATEITAPNSEGTNGVYEIQIIDRNNTANTEVIDLSTVEYREVDYYSANVDGDGSDNLAYKDSGYYSVGDISSDAVAITADKTITEIDYSGAQFLPTLQVLPHNEDGNVYTKGPGGSYVQDQFYPSWYIVGNKADTLAGLKPAEPWTMGAGLISLIVIGSVALAAGIGFGGWYYSHKMHLKGKYDHMHLDRLKAHVAKLEKTVAMDDKKAAEWDAKHHINHKDTKNKK